jgi:hypothetical protein
LSLSSARSCSRTSIEDVFGPARLGYAAASGLRPFGADVVTG